MPQTDAQSRKLILLYMLRQVQGLSSDEWMRWAIDSLYLDYFSFVQAKEDLIRDHLVSESQRKNERRLQPSESPVLRCDLTPEGEAILDQLLPTLAPHIRSYLYEEGKKRRRTEDEKNSVLAHFAPDANGKVQVFLSLRETGQTVMDISFQTPNEQRAQEICRRWKTSTSDIYMKILAVLERGDSETP